MLLRIWNEVDTNHVPLYQLYRDSFYFWGNSSLFHTKPIAKADPYPLKYLEHVIKMTTERIPRKSPDRKLEEQVARTTIHRLATNSVIKLPTYIKKKVNIMGKTRGHCDIISLGSEETNSNEPCIL
jgi:hypothetical protein